VFCGVEDAAQYMKDIIRSTTSQTTNLRHHLITQNMTRSLDVPRTLNQTEALPNSVAASIHLGSLVTIFGKISVVSARMHLLASPSHVFITIIITPPTHSPHGFITMILTPPTHSPHGFITMILTPPTHSCVVLLR